MTRSLVVTTWFPDRRNPSRTPFCLAHVHALQSQGVRVQVIHVQLRETGPTTREDYEGVPVTRMALDFRRPLTWLKCSRAIRRGLAEAEVLHTMAFSSALVAALPWALRRRPWVHTEHWNGVVDPSSVGGWWQRLALSRHVLRLPSVVTGVTQQLADEMARFARRGATHVVPCVVQPPEKLVPYPPANPLRLVGVGLLNARKDPLLAVRTIAWLRDRGVEVRYEWVGEGPLMAQAEQLSRSLDLDEHVSFPGSVAPTRVLGMIEAAHLFFVPSRQENFFTALAEAIVAGRPAVAPRSGGFVEYCCPDNSELTDSWSIEDLGGAILRARERLGERRPADVAATVADRFSEEQVGRQFQAIYSTMTTSDG
jgi:glycosyltransferase involved in cell wall biosynthesis